MKTAFIDKVVPNLQAVGFSGEYPDYRRIYEDRIDVISVHPYPYGNALYIDVSTAFLRDKNNNLGRNFNGDINSVTTSDCCKIYRLKGNFGDRFYYTDVYYSMFIGMCYEGVSEQRAKTFKPRRTDILVQKANENTYNDVCELINKRMKRALKWLQRMSKK